MNNNSVKEGLISIVIPTFNSEKNIESTLQSIINQSYQDFEIIVIDDGSEDNTVDVLQRLTLTEKRIHLIQQNHAGVSAARNNGLSHSLGEYIAFIDADDLIEHNYLERLVSSIGDYDCCVCGFTLVKNTEVESYSGDDIVINRDNAMQLAMGNNSFNGYLWNKLFRKKHIVNGNINFDETINKGEDLLFVEQYLCRCVCVKNISDTLYKYAYGGVLRSMSISPRRQF